MFPFPPRPELPADQQADAPMSLRYEDIAQDGRLMLDAIPHGLGEVLWQTVLAKHPLREKLTSEGIVPILTRIVAQNLDGPIAVRRSLEASGAFQLAHTVDERGEGSRLIMNLWVDASGAKGRTYGPPPAGAGDRIHVGRVFAEHVFTRLFAPPGERKILRFDGDPSLSGAAVLPAVPAARYSWRAPEELLVLPEDAVPLDAELAPDGAAIVLGLAHTDSNQHVNSLVYPRFFEEAALRRFDHHRRDAAVLSRTVELAYRKPSFAGERVRFLLRAFARQGELGAVGVLVDDRGDDKRPRCYARMSFSR